MALAKKMIDGVEDLIIAIMIVVAVMVLALSNNIDGTLALFAVLSVGAAVGVYRSLGQLEVQ